jgi:AraC-like DNA-binding protein
LLTIRSFIKDNLADPELNLERVARAHNVSVSYLQKLFAEDGHSVSGWIRERRLEHCRRDLGDARLADRSVTAIGSRWGLLNGAHLSRLFKATYGMSPRAYRHAVYSGFSVPAARAS